MFNLQHQQPRNALKLTFSTRTIRIPDPNGKIPCHRTSRTIHPGRIPSPIADALDSVRPRGGRTESSAKVYTDILQLLKTHSPSTHAGLTNGGTALQRASGLFVYAVSTVKFVEKQHADPSEQLDLLLQSPKCKARTKFNANPTLDSLYTSVVLGVFVDSNDLYIDPRVLPILNVVVLAASPLS